MNNLSDHELIKRAKSGDTDCLDILVRRYAGLVRSIVRKSFLTGGEQEDLFQEGLMAIITAVHTYDQSKNRTFSSFIHTCVRNRIIDSIRTATRDKHKPLNEAAPLTEDITPDHAQDPLDIYLKREWADNFREKLAENLTSEQNLILKLYFEGYSYTEIANKIGVNVKKVDNTLFAIKNKLRKEKDLFGISP